MPALPSYIPAKDADLNNWALNFSTLITASPATYGLVSGDATAIAAAYASWNTAYSTAINPSTRTPVAVAAKDIQKLNLLAICRPYAVTISLNAGVTTGNKVTLGVNPRTSVPTPITAPTTNPVLTIDQALALQHVVRFRDSLSSPSVKSKPYGVTQCFLYGMTSATLVTNPASLPFIGPQTKSPCIVSWTSADLGKNAYYAARWATRTGLLSPFSPIISFVIAG